MRVVIDSATDKLEAGLTVAKNLVSRFAEDGGRDLSLFDKAVSATAGGIEGIASKANLVLSGLAAVKSVIDMIGASADAFAAQTGTEDQLEDVKTAAVELQGAVLTGLKTAFDDVKESAFQTVGNILGFGSSVQDTNYTASNVAEDGLRKLGDAFKYIRQSIEDYLPASKRSLSTLEEDIDTAKEKLQGLQDQFAALQTMDIGVDPASLDLLKQEIAGLQTQIFVLNQMAGGERILAAAKADRAVESSKGIEGLRAETEAMELNVETMRMSTVESAIYRAELKARQKLEEEGLDEDAIDRAIDKLSDRYSDAADAVEKFNASKKHDEDAKQYLDRLNQETDALRDRVAVLGMATAAAAAYTQQARNQRAIAALGDLDPQTMEKINAQLAEQRKLNQQLTTAEDQRKRQQLSEREGNNFEQIIAGLQRQTAQIMARTAAMYDGTEAGRVQAIVDQQLVNLQARHIEISPQRIAAIRDQAQAQVEATIAQEDAQRMTKLTGDVGNAVTSNLDSAFRNFTRTGKFSFHDMTMAIIQDLEQIAIKAAVITPLTNLMTGGTSGGGGALGSLLSLFGSSGSSSSGWATTIIPAFADGGDFSGGPMIVGERGPELIWPKFPGTVIPNNALPNAVQQATPSPNVEVNVINNSGAQVSQERRQSGGLDVVDIVIGAVKDGIAGGKLDSALGGRFGANVTPRER